MVITYEMLIIPTICHGIHLRVAILRVFRKLHFANHALHGNRKYTSQLLIFFNFFFLIGILVIDLEFQVSRLVISSALFR